MRFLSTRVLLGCYLWVALLGLAHAESTVRLIFRPQTNKAYRFRVIDQDFYGPARSRARRYESRDSKEYTHVMRFSLSRASAYTMRGHMEAPVVKYDERDYVGMNKEVESVIVGFTYFARLDRTGNMIGNLDYRISGSINRGEGYPRELWKRSFLGANYPARGLRVGTSWQVRVPLPPGEMVHPYGGQAFTYRYRVRAIKRSKGRRLVSITCTMSNRVHYSDNGGNDYWKQHSAKFNYTVDSADGVIRTGVFDEYSRRLDYPSAFGTDLDRLTIRRL